MTSSGLPETLHANCVSVEGAGILIVGPSGSGKSDLTLRLIDEGAILVADDRVVPIREADALLAGPAPGLEGKMEVRGFGIVEQPYLARVSLRLVVQLTKSATIERLPEKQFWSWSGHKVRLVQVDAMAASATARIRLVLSQS